MWNNFFMLQRDMLQYMFIIFRNIVNNILIYLYYNSKNFFTCKCGKVSQGKNSFGGCKNLNLNKCIIRSAKQLFTEIPPALDPMKNEPEKHFW